MITGLLKREILALLRRRADVLNPLGFMFLAIMLFAIASPVTSRDVSHPAAILWLIVLLTQMLSLDTLFRRDFDSGVLEQIMVTATVPFLVIGVRIFAQWLSSGGIMIVLSPVLCLLLGMPASLIPWVMLSLLLGTPALSLLGAVGASLTVGLSRGGALLGLLALPLFLPLLIFGTSAINEQIVGAGNTAQFYWLFFISMLALSVGPFAATAGLRISLQLQ